ncbi:hypothetical protein ACFQVD_44760 [Streptosporangium amethystogenes subsp. fukuiense]|uniref:Secreted protein n=1 Tax=Streptosporangium amethystogenes subsp. fukuiense TaxID=698418 RepID=A0ABW2THH0_9ACTN
MGESLVMLTSVLVGLALVVLTLLTLALAGFAVRMLQGPAVVATRPAALSGWTTVQEWSEVSRTADGLVWRSVRVRQEAAR